MDDLSTALLKIALLVYVVGAAAGLLFLRSARAAIVCSFGCGVLAGLTGSFAFVTSLLATATESHQSFAVVPSLIPYLQFTIRIDPLGAFFGLIVSLLA